MDSNCAGRIMVVGVCMCVCVCVHGLGVLVEQTSYMHKN